MSTVMQQIINKYQGIAPQKVVHAVERAAAKTGADFSFLMEKAAAESSFNPNAKARTSSATGLFQFIESTWLNMVKEHGAKYGLGKLACQIETRNGKPCVDDKSVRAAILNLRKNPEISALMAGELSAGNKEYLEAHTSGDVGAPELYLAHFLGASGAAKFINNRDENGYAVAARMFPKEARANKNVFFDPSTGHARTLDEIYAKFANKFDAGETRTAAAMPRPAYTPSAPVFSPLEMSQAVLSSDGIIWNDAPDAARTGFSHSASLPMQKLSAENMMLLAQQMRHDATAPVREREEDKPRYNT